MLGTEAKKHRRREQRGSSSDRQKPVRIRLGALNGVYGKGKAHSQKNTDRGYLLFLLEDESSPFRCHPEPFACHPERSEGSRSGSALTRKTDRARCFAGTQHDSERHLEGVANPEDWPWSSYNNFALDASRVRGCPIRIDYVACRKAIAVDDHQSPRSERY